MKLNLHILAEELADLHFESHCTVSASVFDCPLPALFDDCSMIKPGCCFICKATQLPSDPSHMKGCALICIGRPPDAYLSGSVNCIWTEEPLARDDLVNFILTVYRDYEQLFSDLQRCVDDKKPLRELGAIIQKRIGNPLFCATTSYCGLFHIIDDFELATPEFQKSYLEFFNGQVPFPEGSFLSLRSVDYLIHDEKFAKTLMKREPVRYALENLPFPNLFQTIYLDGEIFGWLIVHPIYRTPSEKDESLLCIGTRYLTKLIANMEIQSLFPTDSLEVVVDDLLAHRLLPKNRIDIALERAGWSSADEYFCLIANMTVRFNIPMSDRHLARRLSQQIPGSYPTFFDGRLVLVCNLTKFNLTQKYLCTLALPIIENSTTEVGISRIFDDFKDFYYYYRQSLSALETGKRLNPEGHTHYYETYASDIIADEILASKQPLESFFPEGLRLLIRYDRQEKTNLTSLLRAYLECDCSVTKTVRKAFIHKNTCAYRLNKINEITGFDLDDPHLRFELSTAFALMDHAARNGGTALPDSMETTTNMVR